MSVAADTYGPSTQAGNASGDDCSWCGLRRARADAVMLGGSKTCDECAKAGRAGRVKAYLQRLRRAAQGAR